MELAIDEAVIPPQSEKIPPALRINMRQSTWNEPPEFAEALAQGCFGLHIPRDNGENVLIFTTATLGKFLSDYIKLHREQVYPRLPVSW